MKKQFAIVTSIVLVFVCGCADRPDHEKLVSESSVVVLCRNHVKDGMIWAEISEVWRDESNGAFTKKSETQLKPMFLLTHRRPAAKPPLCFLALQKEV